MRSQENLTVPGKPHRYRHRRRFLPLIVCVAFLWEGSAAATILPPCVETLVPSKVVTLPSPTFFAAQTLAWNSNGRLVIGTRAGILSYDPDTARFVPLVSGQKIPNGIPDVVGLDSDGKSIFAFNSDYSDLVADARSGKVTGARREPSLQIADVALRGGKLAVLGFPLRLRTKVFAQLWIGTPGAPWETFLPLHPVDGAAEEIVRYAIPPNGGAVTFANDGTVAMISPAEPGVFRYRVDGTVLPTLGRNLRELVITRLPEAIRGYRLDIGARYREILNKQPTVDDLISTADGLAIVVRRWSSTGAAWELWFPDTQGVRRRVQLQLSSPGVVAGHLHCSVQGARLACVFDRRIGADKPPVNDLAIFDLTATKRSASCR
jgi:hypothetical protein